MKPVTAQNNVDIRALALANAQIGGCEPLLAFARLVEEVLVEGEKAELVWSASFETRAGATGVMQPWMRLTLTVSLSLACQRCMGDVAVPVVVDRWFRFVDSEEAAEREDEQSDEDVLVLEKQFRLHDLIEDEVLMSVPVVPRHETCPGNVILSAVDPGFELAQATKPMPFEALATLRNAKKG